MRVAVYARVSTEHEAQINALENQLEWYKIECSRHSDWEIVEVYVDQGITGTQAQKRPEFLRMMEDAKKDKFDLIITREVSRFARNTVDALSYTRQMKAMGVDVLFINDGINTAADDGELRLSLMSSMAQDESRKISERVKAGQRISREKHILYGNGNILGYRRVNGTYVPEPEQAETVRLIFQMYSSGEVGLQKIVAELYRLGRLDAGGHVSWDASKVSRVLHNATYKGCICYNKSHSDGYLTQKRIKNLDESSYIYVKGDFEPLVSEEMWERCQQILASRSARVIDENGKKHKYMNDVSNRAVREFSEFLNSLEAEFPKPTCTTAYEITMKSTIVSALITLDTEKQMDERFWNHLRVQRNILDFLYTLWLDDDRTLVDEFSTIIKDLVEYDFSIVEEQMKERLNIA